jgi:hypothetical protein
MAVNRIACRRGLAAIECEITGRPFAGSTDMVASIACLPICKIIAMVRASFNGGAHAPGARQKGPDRQRFSAAQFLRRPAVRNGAGRQLHMAILAFWRSPV